MWFIINKYVLYAGIMHMYIHSHSLCLLTKSFFRSDRMCSLCERQKLFHWNLWGYALGGRRQVQAFQCCSVKYALSAHARLKIVKNSNPGTTPVSKLSFVMYPVLDRSNIPNIALISVCVKNGLCITQNKNHSNWRMAHRKEKNELTMRLDFLILFSSVKRNAFGSSGRW